MSTGLSLIRGAASASVAGVLVYGFALTAGFAQSASKQVFLVGAAVGVAIAFIEPSNSSMNVIGAAIIGIAGVISGARSGWGWLEYSVVVGAAIAILWFATGERHIGSWHRWFRWGGVLLPLLVFLLLPLILDGGTLGFDEAAYAVKARSWLEGTTDAGWELHRGTGMSAYGYLVLALGGSEVGLRTLGLAGALALTAGVWALGRTMTNPTVGAIAAAGVVAGPAILRRSTEFLSDVPAAALLVFCMVIVWREFGQRALPTFRLLWVLPLAWVAFYLRYQSILSLGLIAMVVVILWWPKIKQRPAPVLWMVGVGLLGLIPHAITATHLTGNPWGLVTYTAGVAVRAYVGEGLADYARQLIWLLAGFVGPVAVVAAVSGLAWSWRDLDTRRPYVFLLLPASLQVIVLGLLSHGEPRFVFFPLALVLVAGAISLQRWVSTNKTRLSTSLAVGLMVLLIGSLATSAVTARSGVEFRARFYLPAESAALEVRDQAGTSTCGVLTYFAPIITFYSGCAGRLFVSEPDPVLAVEGIQGEERFMIFTENERREPQGAERAALVALTDGPPVIIEGPFDAAVYRFAD